MTSSHERRRIGVVLFPGFELLDVFGPLEMLGVLSDEFDIVMIGPTGGDVASAQGPRVVAEVSYDAALAVDIVVVPGGIGTRTLVKDRSFLEWLAAWAAPAEFITSVCTGSGVLAAAGLLDGYRATSNKRSFSWASAQGAGVTWIREARWVEDGNRWTSSGVASGIDMALALIAHLHGEDLATGVADRVEYEWHRDSSWDPYAAIHGLVDPRDDGTVSVGDR
jgi:transcriptional regulator GlxA family with amidase domain